MATFAARARRRFEAADDRLVPAGFAALADALDGDAGVDAALQEIGLHAAQEGRAIDDLLDDLAVTYQGWARAPTPPFDVVRRLASAWADASLSYLHGVSCEDPLTGLASLAHVRCRLGEIYREADSTGVGARPAHSLLVVEVLWGQASPAHLDRLMRIVDVSELLRTVYDGDETIGQLNASRVVAVVRRDGQTGAAVAALLGLLRAWEDRCSLVTRLWIEGLPGSLDSAGLLLDELAR